MRYDAQVKPLPGGSVQCDARVRRAKEAVGQGGQIGPVLNGAAANGLETLLRAVITPNAAMEAGYRTFRIELKDGDTLDGFLVSEHFACSCRIDGRAPEVNDFAADNPEVSTLMDCFKLL